MTASFGLAGPLGWFVELNKRLGSAAERLAQARSFFEDPKRDCSDEIDAEAKAKIRIAVTAYLSEIFTMLHAMPLVQQQPQILEALQFIVAEVASLDRGAVPGWLIPNPSKRHLKSTTKEAEWVPIIAALQLALFLSGISSEESAAKIIQSKRPVLKIGTIKDWHKKLYNKGKPGSLPEPSRKAAAESTRTIVNDMRAILLVVQDSDERDRLLTKRIDELLDL